MEGVPFVNRKYTKGVPFSSKMVYKRVRGWTSGEASPCENLLSIPRDKDIVTLDKCQDGEYINQCSVEGQKVDNTAAITRKQLKARVYVHGSAPSKRKALDLV